MGARVKRMQIRTSEKRGIASPRLALFLVSISLVSMMTLVGCQGGGAGSLATSAPNPTSEDCVHRIVASGELRVGISGVQPPLNMKNWAGELVGLDVDLARALARAMNLDLVLIEKPFAELLPGLEENEFDLVISMLTITPARNARVAFAGPYMISGATLLTQEERVDEFNRLEALNSADRTWGAIEGSTSQELIQQAFPLAKLVTTNDLASLVPQITDGAIDGLISDLPYVRFQLARNPGVGLAVLPTPFTTEPLGVALPAGSPLFANLVQNYLNTLEYTGQLIQMKARWLNGGDWLSEIP
jgi:polar amino acid transport system substrate-binding protein